MGKAFIQESTLTAIANAIRGKNGSSDTYLPSEMPQAIINIPSGTPTQYNVLCFTAEQANSTVYIKCHKDLNINLQYSYDNENWTTWTSTLSGNNDVFSTITLTNVGDKVYIRGHNGTMGFSNTVYSQFNMGGRIAASGNIQSLLTYDADSLSVANYCYYYMFYNCTALTTAPELPATALTNNCYQYMFYGCTSLTMAPALPAKALAQSCYNYMFYNCTALTTAPELPATTLANYCYQYMFYNCTALTTAPELPATTLVSYCYYSMFYGCTALTTAPELPATTLANYCYYSMFSGCTSLTTAPEELPATRLIPNCYAFMFNKCTALTTAPELPATTLAQNCYYNMFSECTSLTTAPELPATTLVNNCYNYMFQNCTNLNYIRVGATSWNTSYASNWVNGVAATGTFIKQYGATITTGTSGIPSGWTTYNSQVISYNYSTNYCSINTDLSGTTIYYTTDGTEPTTSSQIYTEPFYLELKYFTLVKSLTVTSQLELYVEKTFENLFYIKLESSGTVKYNGQSNSYQYSTDGITWTNYTNNSNISVSGGSKIFFKKYTNLGYISTNSGQSYKFTVSSNYNVGGCLSMMSHGGCKNGMYLLGSNLDGTGSYTSSGGRYLFYNETKLKDASKLIVNIQGTGISFNTNMFYGCTSLTKAPELPATMLSTQCYSAMFSGCAALTTAPELPATSLAESCYSSMFSGCAALTTAPELPATTLAQSCYHSMFSGCTALTTAPELPATTLAYGCYQRMFYNCTALTTAPELPATTPPTYCYHSMFYGCSQLNYIKVGATSWNTSYTYDWVKGVASTGDFYKPTNTSITTGTAGIPSGWTVHNE